MGLTIFCSLLLVYTATVIAVGAKQANVRLNRFPYRMGPCAASYPRLLRNNETGLCFEVGSQGPCGKLMTFTENPSNPIFGTCTCSDLGTANCAGRPVLYWPVDNRCYFAFSQGPCKKGYWLVMTKNEEPQCRKNPCPIIEDQKHLLEAEESLHDFYFWHNNKCYLTGTRGFCKSGGETAYFVGSSRHPECFRSQLYSCGGSKTNGEGAFGIPTDEV